MISALIFDFDGTIIDTEWSDYVTIRDEFRRHGLDYPLDEFLPLVGRADHRHWSEVMAERLDDAIDLAEARKRRRLAHAEMIAGSPVLPGVVDLIDRAADRDLPVAVASSSPLSWVACHLGRRKLSDRFEVVATRDDVERAKPWPDVFLHAATGLGVDPGRCLVIEDSSNGVVAAKAAGMRCVAVPNRITTHSDLSPADAVIESLDRFPFDRFGLA